MRTNLAACRTHEGGSGTNKSEQDLTWGGGTEKRCICVFRFLDVSYADIDGFLYAIVFVSGKDLQSDVRWAHIRMNALHFNFKVIMKHYSNTSRVSWNY